MITGGICVNMQTEEAALRVELREVRERARERHDGLLNGNARYACCLADALRGVNCYVLDFVKDNQETRGIIGDARALDAALPPRRALPLMVEPHLVTKKVSPGSFHACAGLFFYFDMLPICVLRRRVRL